MEDTQAAKQDYTTMKCLHAIQFQETNTTVARLLEQRKDSKLSPELQLQHAREKQLSGWRRMSGAVTLLCHTDRARHRSDDATPQSRHISSQTVHGCVEETNVHSGKCDIPVAQHAQFQTQSLGGQHGRIQCFNHMAPSDKRFSNIGKVAYFQRLKGRAFV
jgi:hypothetical protein